MRTFQRRSMECQLPLHAGKNTKTPTTTETTIRFQEALNRIVRRVLPPPTARVDYGGNLYLMGARHLWVDDPNVQDSCSTQDPTGENAYQSDDYYGHVKHHFQDYDAALTNIEADDQEGQPQRDGFTDTIVDENGYIEGYVDSNGIDDMMANNLEVRKRHHYRSNHGRNRRILGQLLQHERHETQSQYLTKHPRLAVSAA